MKQWLKSDAQRAGLIAENYSAYSLRRGLATSLFLLGASADTIKRLGRWRSDAYKRYIQVEPHASQLWESRLVSFNIKDYAWLTIDEAAELKLSSVDEFCRTHTARRKLNSEKGGLLSQC
jgi:hypothetical protein